MKQYTGTKTIQACPMTLGEAEQVLNRHIDTSAVENREQVPGDGHDLREQLSNMQNYAKALASRIANAKCAKAKEDALKDLEAKKQQETEQKHKQLQSLVGMTVVEAGHCDFCPSEPTDCKKLILADGSHICLKDVPAENNDRDKGIMATDLIDDYDPSLNNGPKPVL
ncbi:MAG: hypothetical protein IJV36_06060 [Prevotella sp.]|nr:hypothetical protein [Prevotella sp.]